MNKKRWSRLSIHLRMFVKLSIICLYLSVSYWIASHFSLLGMLFYPSLGSFTFLLMRRENFKKDLYKIMLGATVTSSIGSGLYFLYPSIFTFFFVALITLYIMQKFNWDAAPILAVALIPFFSHPESIWVLPFSVLCSLVGLHVPLWLIQKLENKKQSSLSNNQIHMADKMDIS